LETPKDFIAERGEATSRTQLYHHAKCHADQPHLCDNICPQTERQKERITADLVSDKTRTSIVFAGCDQLSISDGIVFMFVVANPLALGLPPMMAADGKSTASYMIHHHRNNIYKFY